MPDYATKLTELDTTINEVKQELATLKAELHAKQEYEKIAKEEKEKQFNRTLALGVFLVSVFGVILPILVQLFVVFFYGKSD
jgi:F0F1-type ATP synthase assembly protein I